MPEKPQEHRDARRRIDVVVYDEDRALAGGLCDGRGLGKPGFERERQARQPHGEGGALARALALGAERAAMQRHEAAREREPDAEPAFGPIERALALRKQVEDALEQE